MTFLDLFIRFTCEMVCVGALVAPATDILLASECRAIKSKCKHAMGSRLDLEPFGKRSASGVIYGKSIGPKGYTTA